MGDLPLAVIGLFSVMCGMAVGILSWLASQNAPAGILAGLTSTGACIVATVQLISTVANWN